MLILTGFLLLMLFLFASGMFAAAVAGQRAERVFLPVLILNAFLLYIAAACHRAEAGFAVILTANLALYIPVIFRMKREGIRTVLNRFLTPGIIFALIFLTGFFILTLWRKFYSWDEISHWGAAAQLFFRDGKLGCEYGGILSHASYPPGACLIAMMTHYCFPGVPFSENIVMFGHELLLLGIWLYPLAGLDPVRRWQSLMISMAYLGFVPVFLREDFHTCYTDAPLACLFGLCIYAVLTLRKNSAYDLFALGLLTAFLFPVRNAGFGYAVMVLALLAVKLLLDRKQYRFSPWLFFVFLLPFAVKYSWSFLLEYYETPLKFGGTAITPAAIWDAFIYNIPEKSHTVIKAFLLRLTCGYLEAFIAIMIGLLLLKRRSISADRAAMAKRGIVFFSLAFTLFLITTLIFYIFEFNELRTIPSFDRYVSAFLIAPAFLLLFLWNDEWTERSGSLAPEKDFGLSDRKRRRLFWILAGWCFIATVYNFIPYAMFVWRKHRIECDRMKTDYHQILAEPDVHFALITSTGKGFKNFYGSYLYPGNFHELKAWDPVLVKQAEPSWDYTLETTPEKLRSEIVQKELDYVYIESIRPEFPRDFASVFTGMKQAPLTPADLNNRLFRVLPDGHLTPVEKP